MDACGTHAWQWMYPPLQSHDEGWLAVGDGHEIHWEVCGNPMGTPAVFVHGGPGAGCVAGDRRWFDPSHYRIVLFDQRGAGRSTPQGALHANTTEHLLRDMEALRMHLEVDRWLLFGGSWGATLSLAYAQRHPQRAIGLVLRGLFTAGNEERRWLYTDQGAALLYPEGWQRLTATIPPAQRGDPLAALAAGLHCGDPAAENAAAQAWLQWEQELMDFELNDATPRSNGASGRLVPVAGAALAAARIGVHFAQHRFFLQEAQLPRRAARLHCVPGVIVHGGRDLVTRLAAAEALHFLWPGSRLVEVPSAGHASSHPGMARRLIEATDGFRDIETSVARTTPAPTLASPTTMETSDEGQYLEQ